jgi:hypothetical protein
VTWELSGNEQSGCAPIRKAGDVAASKGREEKLEPEPNEGSEAEQIDGPEKSE